MSRTTNNAESPEPVAVCVCGQPLLAGQRCPECGRPFNRVQPTVPLWPWLMPFIGTALALFLIPASTSSSGVQLSITTLPFTLLFAGLAWVPFAFGPRRPLFLRIVMMLAVIITTLILAKNIADVL